MKTKTLLIFALFISPCFAEIYTSTQDGKTRVLFIPSLEYPEGFKGFFYTFQAKDGTQVPVNKEPVLPCYSPDVRHPILGFGLVGERLKLEVKRREGFSGRDRTLRESQWSALESALKSGATTFERLFSRVKGDFVAASANGLALEVKADSYTKFKVYTLIGDKSQMLESAELGGEVPQLKIADLTVYMDLQDEEASLESDDVPAKSNAYGAKWDGKAWIPSSFITMLPRPVVIGGAKDVQKFKLVVVDPCGHTRGEIEKKNPLYQGSSLPDEESIKDFVVRERSSSLEVSFVSLFTNSGNWLVHSHKISESEPGQEREALVFSKAVINERGAKVSTRFRPDSQGAYGVVISFQNNDGIQRVTSRTIHFLGCSATSPPKILSVEGDCTTLILAFEPGVFDCQGNLFSSVVFIKPNGEEFTVDDYERIDGNNISIRKSLFDGSSTRSMHVKIRSGLSVMVDGGGRAVVYSDFSESIEGTNAQHSVLSPRTSGHQYSDGDFRMTLKRHSPGMDFFVRLSAGFQSALGGR